MSLRNMQAVILWTKDKKVGVEKIANVPDSQRFVGAVTPVKFSGDKKFYPAKVLFISDNKSDVEDKAKEVEAEIAKSQEQSRTIPASGSTRKRTKKNASGNVASEQAVAIALGGRPPVPSHLKETHEAHQKSKKEAKMQHRKGQLSLDQSVSEVVRDLFPKGKSSQQKTVSGASLKDRADSWESGPDEDDGEMSGSESHNSQTEAEAEDEQESDAEGPPNKKRPSSSTSESCSCRACGVLQKYDDPVYSNFLLDMVKLMDHSQATTGNSSAKNYLKLKEIPSTVKQVELVTGKGVKVALTDKEQLKVDYHNKPSALVRETLYVLFGKRCFQQLIVTGSGTKPGTYAIAPEILATVCTFVNRNVKSDQALKRTQLVSLINKRAPEWRKGRSESPKTQKVVKKQKPTTEQVISTSPFKSSPLKPPATSDLLPVGTPLKKSAASGAPATQTPVEKPTSIATASPIKTPAKKSATTPLKSPAQAKVGGTPMVQESQVTDMGGYQPNGQFFQPSYNYTTNTSHGHGGAPPNHYGPGFYGNNGNGYGYYGSQSYQSWDQTSNNSGPSYLGL